VKATVAPPDRLLARQQITNMEKLVPGFAEPETGDEADRVTLVLARTQREVMDWWMKEVDAGRLPRVPPNRIRRVASAQDLKGMPQVVSRSSSCPTGAYPCRQTSGWRLNDRWLCWP
jgi:hypothetical protein